MQLTRTDTLIIGAGQSGLVMSHMLKRRGCPHVVLERHRIGERWCSERWDGLRFQFPNWSVSLPDFPFPHSDPEGFATGREIVEFISAYAAFVGAPVRTGVTVTRLSCCDHADGFIAETSEGPVAAANVVVATGPYQRPRVPDLSPGNDVFQVHASRYTSPDQLPPGAVLVVGSGASGAQITEELCRAGRRVYLSVGHHRRMPRRYRGHDLMWWLTAMGLDQTPVEQRGPDTALPLITGAYGGHTIDFRRYAAQGVVLLGHITSVESGVMHIAPDLGDSVAHGDAAYDAFLDLVDAHVERHGLDLPPEPTARMFEPDPACALTMCRALDLRSEGVTSIIWATGYAFDFGWIDIPVLDVRGAPVHRHGVSAVPGLYFLGLPWLSRMCSSFLSGVGEDAAQLASHIFMRRTAHQACKNGPDHLPH